MSGKNGIKTEFSNVCMLFGREKKPNICYDIHLAAHIIHVRYLNVGRSQNNPKVTKGNKFEILQGGIQLLMPQLHSLSKHISS